MSLLQNFSENNGYFNTRTRADSTRAGKKVKANYIIIPGKQYRIKSVKFPSDSSALGITIREIQDQSLLKIGQAYSLDIIKTERIRIDTRLKEKGFFYFNADYLKIQVDSTVAKHEVDLIVKVKDETPDAAKTAFKINKIVIYPNYSIDSDTITSSEKYKDFTIIGNDNLFKPRIFDRTLYFKKGDLYNRTNHNLSLTD